MMSPVERVPAARFGQHQIDHHQPVIVTGSVTSWPAYRLWDLDYLADRMGPAPAQVAVSANGIFRYSEIEPDRQYGIVDMSSQDFLLDGWNEDSSSTTGYIMAQSIPDRFPMLVNDIVTPPWIDGEPCFTSMWLGPRGTTTPLHYDLNNNLFGQVVGAKRFVLFPPSETSCLYPHPLGSHTSHLSYLDIENVDPDAHPDFDRSAAIECEVVAGEMLYVPAYWWHHVRSLSVSASVSFWWPAAIDQHLEPNGVRQLWTAYRGDRLCSVKSEVLDPNGLTWLEAASIVATRSWSGAALLLGAALDEAIRQRLVEAGRPTLFDQMSLADLSHRLVDTGTAPAAWLCSLQAVAGAVDRLADSDDLDHDGAKDLAGELVALISEGRSVTDP